MIDERETRGPDVRDWRARALARVRISATTGICAAVVFASAISSYAGDDAKGRRLFCREWLPGGSRPVDAPGDGLGPVYNESSCVACHYQGGPGGSGPRNANVQMLTADTPAPELVRLAELHPGFLSSKSLILHRYGVEPGYKAWRLRLLGDNESADKIGTIETTIVQGRAVLEMTMSWAGLDHAQDGLTLSERNPPPLFGLGLIDTIPDEVLLAGEKRKFQAFREVRGHARRLENGKVGRFGWKAEAPTLREFVLSACANDLGLEVSGHHQAKSPLASNPKPTGLDMSDEECEALVSFVRHLRPPSNDGIGDQQNREENGRSLFESIGCATCHAPELGGIVGIYSDLLLHDMGAVLADAGDYYKIAGPDAPPEKPVATEWRTPPLWGYAESAPYLHDGRARNLEEAVAFHAGEAAGSAERFFKLNAHERLLVQLFLRSLGRSEQPGVR
jgi:CxxC motif-containing protein (DUF1111 family)